nr:hypothetical protein [Tanacetum cinerariifolium]
MVSNVNVLGPGVLDIIAAESNGTAIVTIQGNLIEDKVVVCWKDKFILDAEGNPTTATHQPKWQRFMTLVKQSQELKHVSYHKLYDILKQHQHEVNEIRAEKIARVANTLALVAQQQQVSHHQTRPTHFNQNSSTRTHQSATMKREKVVVNSPQPIYDQEPSMVDDDEDTRVNQDNSPQIHRNAGYEGQRSGTVAGARDTVGSSMVQKSGIQCYNCKEYGHVARECQKLKRAKDAAYHREKMLLYVDDSGPIFDKEPEQKVQNDDHYDVFAIDCQHSEQSESIHNTYLIEQDAQNVSIESVDMTFDSEQIDQNDEDVDLAKERELLASLITKLKCEINESKNRNTLLETSNKVLIEKLKSATADFKNKHKSLTEANNKLSEVNAHLYADYKKSKAELQRRNTIEYATEMELEYAKVRGDLLSYKMEYERSSKKYTHIINGLNQMVSELKEKLSAHQDTISILKQQKDAQIKLYKTREDKDIEKVIDLENKFKNYQG